MDAARGPVLPGPNDGRSRSPWKRMYGRHMVASINQLADSALTMRSFSDISRTDDFDRGPGTPDVILHYGRRPGSRPRSSSLLSGKSTPPDVPAVRSDTPYLSKQETISLEPVASAYASNETSRNMHLVMPSARRASGMILNDCSPPLSPVNGERPIKGSGAIQEFARFPPFDSQDHTVSPQPQAVHFSGAQMDASKHETPWPELWSSRSRLPSPPSSLDSVAPSLSWSLSSPDEEAVSPNADSKSFLSYIGMNRLWSFFSTSGASLARADIDPSSRSFSWNMLAPHAFKVVLLGLLFLGATFVLGLCLSTLPLHFPTHLTSLTLSEMRDMCQSLRTYASSSYGAMIHVFLVLTTFFVWKQAFCVPGSLITNIIYGAMYGAYAGAFFASIFTAVGGVLCYLLAAPFADLVTVFPKLSRPLQSMRVALQKVSTSHDSAVSGDDRKQKNNLWTYLLFLRLLPIVPYGMMNIACGVLAVPLLPYAVTMAIGSIPWNFCTAQVGDILQDVATAIQQSTAASSKQAGTIVASASGGSSMLASGTLTILFERIWTWDMIIKLVLLSIASALPLFLQRYLDSRKVHEHDASEEGTSGLDPRE